MPELDPRVSELMRAARSAVGATLVVLTRFAADTGQVRTFAWSGLDFSVSVLAVTAVQRVLPDFDPTSVTFSADVNSLTRAVYRQGETVCEPTKEIARGTVDPRVIDIAASVVGVWWALSIPLRVRDEIWGALTFLGKPPNPAERQVCEEYARQTESLLEEASQGSPP